VNGSTHHIHQAGHNLPVPGKTLNVVKSRRQGRNIEPQPFAGAVEIEQKSRN
jgi:hypothetical protein